MISWLIEQTFVITPLLLILIFFQKMGFKKLNASVVYLFWLIIPLSLLLSYIDFTQLHETTIGNQELLNYQEQLTNYNQVIQQISIPLLSIWSIGFFFSISNYLTSHFLFLKHLDINECFSLKKLLPVNVNAYYSSRLSTPISAGFFSKFIVIPKTFHTDYSKQQQLMIIEHELQHIKRGDLYWNLLAMLIHSTFWFNPIVWYARKYFYLCQEVSCDEQVLTNATKKQKLSYLEALLYSQTKENKNSRIISAFSDREIYSFRFNQITSSSKLNKYYLLPSIFLVLLLYFLMKSSVNTIENIGNSLIKPIMRVTPIYPQEAAASNIEGFAIASFSINKNGQTENVQINLSQPSGAFDKEVLNAIKTWRYTKPYSEIDKIEVQVEFRRQESTPLRLEKEGIEGILVTPEL
ncbi:M56 family metallopeptidase [Pseudoalteromonas piscicida]|uniref:M56 family metallopeptidase n=1 Tax=Pseudoalteromonas piscicida TaxID=43662 RepID=UPI0005FA8FE2|nr:M56 family metallopeptidase [Pseudoalteromonas piscicida]KJY91934.1 hypothetical protein TW73_20705 [Pseudoalteromonas piscicida]